MEVLLVMNGCGAGSGDDFYPLLIDSCDVGKVVEADAGIDLLHYLLDAGGGAGVFGKHKYRGAGARDAAAEGACRLACGFYFVETRYQDAANGLDDHVFQAAADEVIVLFHKAGDEARDIAPLAHGVFEKTRLAEDLPGVGRAHCYLRVDDGDVQGWRGNADDIEG